MLSGSFGLLTPSHTPSLTYWRHRLVDIIYDVMALIRGCWRPSPPCLIVRFDMMWLCGGSWEVFVIEVIMSSVMLVKPSVSSLSQV